jgi:hypothetical protein
VGTGGTDGPRAARLAFQVALPKRCHRSEISWARCERQVLHSEHLPRVQRAASGAGPTSCVHHGMSALSEKRAGSRCDVAAIHKHEWPSPPESGGRGLGIAVRPAIRVAALGNDASRRRDGFCRGVSAANPGDAGIVPGVYVYTWHSGECERSQGECWRGRKCNVDF